METEKVSFFKRVKIAIFNLEKYSMFANEKFSKALKYLMLLITIATIVLAFSSTVQLSKETGKFIEYFKTENFPDFKLSNGKLEADKKLEAYDKEYDSMIIIDTTENLSSEKIQEYEKKARDTSYSAIFLNDKIIYRFDPSLDKGYEANYNDVTSTIGIKDITKDKVVNDYLNNDTLLKLKIIIFVYAFLTIFLLNILSLFEDVLIIGLFGWIASKIARVPLILSKTMSLAIYSLTLSVILSTAYSVIYSFTNFEIKYFEIMYMIIAYIYIIAAIMIMKDENRVAGEAVTVEGEVLKTGEQDKIDEEKEDDGKDKDKLPENDDKKNKKIPDTEDKEKNKDELLDKKNKKENKNDISKNEEKEEKNIKGEE